MKTNRKILSQYFTYLCLVLIIVGQQKIVSGQDYKIYASVESKHVTVQPNQLQDEQLANALKSKIDGLNSDGNNLYCTVQRPQFPISNQKTCGGTYVDIGWKIDFELYENEVSGNWKLDFGVDFGRGSAIFIDGVFYQSSSQDLWWSYCWTCEGVLHVDQVFSKGTHQIQVYGSEGCCDGLQEIKILRNNQPITLLAQGVDESLLVGSISYIYANVETKHLIQNTLFLTDEDFASSLKQSVEEGTQENFQYCSVRQVQFPFNNQNLCTGSFMDIGWKFNFVISDTQESTWQFNLGVDFGRGSAVYVDDQLIYVNQQDLWWGGDWNSDQVIRFEQTLSADVHNIVVYGSEYCCDGLQDVLIYRNGEQVTLISNGNQIEEDPNNYVYVSVKSKEVLEKTQQNKDSVEFSDYLKSLYEASSQQEGYCTVNHPQFPLNNQQMCGGSSQNIGWNFDFQVTEIEGNADWVFTFGFDFGLGTAIYVNDKLVFSTSDDIWWSGDWNSEDVIKIQQTFSEGIHHIIVYGWEGCCDGLQDVLITRNGEKMDLLTGDFYIQVLQNLVKVNVETKYMIEQPIVVQDEEFEENLIDSIENNKNLYCEYEYVAFPLNNQELCSGPYTNIGWKFTITLFESEESASWYILFGVDFGRGNVVYVDQQLYSYSQNDFWWAGNWNGDGVIRIDQIFSQGEHQINIYGSEGCCDGLFDIKVFRNNNQLKLKVQENKDKYKDQSQVPIQVNIETKFLDVDTQGEGEEFGVALRDSVEYASQPQGYYCSKENAIFPLNNFDLCGGPRENIGWKFEFKFTVEHVCTLELQFGVDFGKGGAYFIDNEWVESFVGDLWWNGNWQDSEAVFVIKQNFKEGDHQILVYGHEDCCDGYFDVRFKINDNHLEQLSVENVQKQILSIQGNDPAINETAVNELSEAQSVSSYLVCRLVFVLLLITLILA